MSTPTVRTLVLGVVIVVASMAALSAHLVRGVGDPTLAKAFVSSPSATQDAPIRISWQNVDTGLRVACFNVANSSPARADDPSWPRITAVGFELPGSPTGFSLLEPLNGDWALEEGLNAEIPGQAVVTLDFSIVALVNPAGRSPQRPHEPRGIGPGQPEIRGTGTRFCVSGPFPDTLPNPVAGQPPVPTTIELILNGVVVGFDRVAGHGPSTDVGLWANPQRVVPLYPD